MKRITVTLTEDQLRQVVKSLEWGRYDGESQSLTKDEKDHNAFINRIIKLFVDASRLVR